MFEFIRSNKRWVLIVLLLLIIPSFVFVGVEGFSRLTASDQALATVGKQSVELTAFEEAKKERAAQLQAQSQGKFDPAMLNTSEAKLTLLNEMIDELVVKLIVGDNYMTTTDSRVQQQILEMPYFHNDKGEFDKTVYESVLKQNNLNPSKFEAMTRAALAASAIYDPILKTGRTPQTVLNRIIRDMSEQRFVQGLFILAQNFAPKVKVTDADLKAFYDKNTDMFKSTETVDAQFIILDPMAFAGSVNVSEEEVKKYYETNKASFTSPEERRVSHIFFNFPTDPKAKAALKTKVEGIAKELAAKPQEFSAFVKKYSEDTGSVAAGGDLNWFGRDSMEKAIADVAFKMTKGQVSGVVESSAGFHILLLTDSRASQVKPLEGLQAEIKSKIYQGKMGDIFAAKSKEFRDLVYEQASSLDPAAKQLGLNVELVKGISREPSPMVAHPDIMTNPQVLQALFSPEVLTRKQNSGIITLQDGRMVALRVAQHAPARVPKLDEIRDQVRARFIQTRAVELAVAEGKVKLAELQKKDSTQGFSPPLAISRSTQTPIAPEILKAVMGADIDKLPSFVGVEIPNQGYVVMRIGHVEVPKDIPQEQVDSFKQNMSARLAASEQRALAKFMRTKYDVNVTGLGTKTVGDDSSKDKASATPKAEVKTK